MAALDVAPDFEYRAKGAGRLDYIPRESHGADIYFVPNTQPRPSYAQIVLRA